MTAKASICLALLKGKTISLKDCFKVHSISNPAREIPRMIERPFGVEVKREHKTGKSKFGTPVSWTDYSLPFTEENKPGIKEMIGYVNKNFQRKK